jgi:hypothetical protein
MGNYTKITTHEQDAIDNFIFIFRKKGNVKDLFLGDRWQDIENCISDIYDSRFIDRATGVSLDQIGLEVGEPRPLFGPAATDDVIYRILIKARIAANASNSLLSDVVGIMQILGAENIYVRYLFPAGFYIAYSGADILTKSEIRDILISATEPVSIDIVKISSTRPFGFLGNPLAYGLDDGLLGE